MNPDRDGSAGGDSGARELTPARLIEILSDLGHRISDADEVGELLQKSVDLAKEAIPGADSCGVTVDLAGRTFTAALTDSRTLAVDARQYELDEGPCLTAARTGEIVVVDCETTDQRWPAFAEAARAEGIRSFLAAPVTTIDARIGSFNLYGSGEAAFDDVDAEVLETMTTVVGRAIGDFIRYERAATVADDLRAAMEGRAPIEQAKGILMAMRRIDENAAFRVLSDEAQRTGRTLRDVASDFVARVSTRDRAVSDADQPAARSSNIAVTSDADAGEASRNP